MTEVEKHQSEIFVPLLYDAHQHDSDKAREILEQEIKGELKIAQQEQLVKELAYNELNEKIHDKSNKKLQYAYRMLQKKISK